nr:hypothetical protein [uncultured Draconibacterium sp.]
MKRKRVSFKELLKNFIDPFGNVLGLIALIIPITLFYAIIFLLLRIKFHCLDSVVSWIDNYMLNPIISYMGWDNLYGINLGDWFGEWLLQNYTYDRFHVLYFLVLFFVFTVLFSYAFVEAFLALIKNIILPTVVGTNKNVKVYFKHTWFLFIPSFNRNYALTATEIKKYKGFLVRESENILPLSSVKAINIKRSIKDRIWGKGHLFFTPENKSIAITWRDVKQPIKVKELIDKLRTGELDFMDVAKERDSSPFFYYEIDPEEEKRKELLKQKTLESANWYYNIEETELEDFEIYIPQIPSNIFSLIYNTKYIRPGHPEFIIKYSVKQIGNEKGSWVKKGDILCRFSDSVDSRDLTKSIFQINLIRKNTTNAVAPLNGYVTNNLYYNVPSSSNAHWKINNDFQSYDENNFLFKIRPIKGQILGNSAYQTYKPIIRWIEQYINRDSDYNRFGKEFYEEIRNEIEMIKNYEDCRKEINFNSKIGI